MNRTAHALVIATSLHDGQYRKGSGLPFVVHPLRVGAMLRQYQDEDLEIAGYLHDTVEDTTHTMTDIYNDFGHRVARLVYDVTKVPGKPWPMPKDSASVLLKTADTLDNTTDVLNGMREGKSPWDMFRRGKKKLTTWRELQSYSADKLGATHGLVTELDEVLSEIERLMNVNE